MNSGRGRTHGATVAPLQAPDAYRQRSRYAWFLGRARRHTVGVVAAAVLVAVFLAAAAAPLIVPRSPFHQDLDLRTMPPGTRNGAVVYLLGTDQLGRDVLSRVVYGARISLAISVSAVVGSAVIGTVLGLATGFWRGPFDRVVMRLADLQLAIPLILLALLMVTLWGPTTQNLILTFAITNWPLYVRVVRSTTLVIREAQFVEAARALGQANVTIARRHIFPNVLNSIIVLGSFQMAQLIILEGALSFLGVGVRPPYPSWGNMLADGRGYMEVAWWLVLFPGLAIVVTALAVNIVGDTLRDVLDPRLS